MCGGGGSGGWICGLVREWKRKVGIRGDSQAVVEGDAHMGLARRTTTPHDPPSHPHSVIPGTFGSEP